MEYNDITRLENELLLSLKEEYSFYQSLYILIDRQRDLIKFDKDEKLLDLFTEIERCHLRIKKSEEKVTMLRQKNPRLFPLAASAPEVKKVVSGIESLITKNMTLVQENELYLRERYGRLREELDQLQNSSKILQYLRENRPQQLFVDSKS